MIDICIASPAFGELPPSSAREVQGFDRRLMDIVRAIGTHYGEDGLDGVYAATKSRIASDPRLKFHVRNNYAYCGDHLIEQLRAYVAENETMLGQYFRGQAPQAPRNWCAPGTLSPTKQTWSIPICAPRPWKSRATCA